jgi:hypothetical protein
VSWKLLWPLPLAALLVASPLRLPARKPPLPAVADPRCDYAWAEQRYLEAYAYRAENPALASRLALAALHELDLCREDVRALKERANGFIQALPL